MIAGLLWLLAGAALLIAAALAVLLALLAMPVHVRAAVDSLHIDEETPFDWRDVSFGAQISGLLGAVRVRFEQSGRNLRSEWRIFGIAAAGRRHEATRRETPGDGAGSGEDTRRGLLAADEREERTRRRSRRKDEPGRREVRRGSKGAESRRTEPRRPRMSAGALRRLLPEAQWLLGEVWRRFKPDVSGRLTYGFPDPFLTGIVHGLTFALPRTPGLGLEPDYAQGTLDGHIEFNLRIYPLEAVVLAVRTCFRPGVKPLWVPELRNRVRGLLRVIPKRTKEAHRI